MTAVLATLPCDGDDPFFPPRLWRPFPEETSDILCLQEGTRELGPRIYGRLAITLLRSPTVIGIESSRSTAADAGSVLLIPTGCLHWLRAQGGAINAATLLLGSSQLRGLAAPARPALVSDPELGARLGSLLAHLRHSIPSGEGVSATRSVVEGLLGRAVPVAAGGRSRATDLAPVREYLGARLGESVPTEALASLSGHTESHLIRAFHLEFGLPPHAYHLRLRLAAAAELLAQGVSVSAVTYECGFADQSHLSRKFKEVYGLTPATWAAAAHRAPARQPVVKRAWRQPARRLVPATSAAASRWSARGLRVGGALAG